MVIEGQTVDMAYLKRVFQGLILTLQAKYERNVAYNAELRRLSRQAKNARKAPKNSWLRELEQKRALQKFDI